jgi:hypothetical protein
LLAPAMRQVPLVAVLALAAFASAQTYVVDAAGGPGSQFTSIATAVASVPDGATLQVRAGSYTPFQVVGKSLRVLCEPGTFVYQFHGSSVGVSNLTAAQSVVIQGLNVSAGWGFAERIGCSACQGPVVFDSVFGSNPEDSRFAAVDCAQVWLRGRNTTVGWRECTLTNSNVVFERVSVAPGLAGPGLTVTGGTLQAVGCAFQGGIPFGTAVGGSMALAQGANVRLLAGTTLFEFPMATWPSIHGDGTVRHDPSIVLPPVPFAPTITAIAEPMPALTSSFQPGAAVASLRGAIGHFGVVGVALPGPVLAVPGIDGALWVDAGTFFPVAFGVVGSTTSVDAALPWSGGQVAGVRAVWQALTFAPAGTLHLSNPSLTLLP